MNVRELIKELQQHDSEMMVVVNGYEGGYSAIKVISEVGLMLNINKEWYYGPHEMAAVKGEEDRKAILIV